MWLQVKHSSACRCVPALSVLRRRGGADVALVSLEELVGLEETAHLLRSPENARRLLASLEEVGSGEGVGLTVEELRREFGLDE